VAKFFFGISTTLFVERYQKEDNMAMSQGERMMRLQEESNRFLSRRQTKDSGQQTLIVQAKASGYIFNQNRTPTRLAIATTVVVGPTDKAIPANVYNPDGQVPTCCATKVTNGSETFDEQNAVLQRAQACAICANPDYATTNGYSIDLRTLGGNCCPLPNLVNTAKTTAAEKCASCLQFYFPTPAQPTCCYGTPYPSSALYPPQPIDWELRRYGEAGVPQTPA
jgi:hypothetical protein